MKLENKNEAVEQEIEKSIGAQVRLQVIGSVRFTYCGTLNRAGESGYLVSRNGGPEIFFDLKAVKVVLFGPMKDVLTIHI